LKQTDPSVKQTDPTFSGPALLATAMGSQGDVVTQLPTGADAALKKFEELEKQVGHIQPETKLNPQPWKKFIR
jgi:hypothetical protein